MRNDLLADIVTASGGTITDRNNRNLLLKDWLEAVQAPAVNYVARLDGTQYWQFTSPINVLLGDVLKVKTSRPSSQFTPVYEIQGRSEILRSSGGDLIQYIGSGSVSVNGGEVVSGVTAYPASANFECIIGQSGEIEFLGVRTDTLTNKFEGVIYGFEIIRNGVVINSIPLTNKAQGATQLATVGNVNATMVGYNEDVWEQV
jgi:hypothetical protein